MAESEYILLKRFSTYGDAEAFAQIIKQHAPMVYGVCLRILANREIAADVVQDTFFQLVRDASEITGSLPNWLHKVATHRSIDIVRSDAQRKKRELNYVSDSNKITAEDEKAVWHEISVIIDEELNKLDVLTREVLILHFFEGQTMTEMAEKFNISQSTISRRIESGIELLRHQLKSRQVIVSAAILTATLTENIVQAAPASIMRELGKIALAGNKTSVNPKIRNSITLAKTKIIAIAASVIVVSSFVIFYAYSSSLNNGQQNETIINDITIDELADICAAMESAYQDISVEYENGVKPAPTFEDIQGTDSILTVGTAKEKWSTKRPFDKRFLSTTNGTYMNEQGETFEQTTKESYNGTIRKHLITGGLFFSGMPAADISLGTITKSENAELSIASPPLGYTIFRSNYIDKKGLLSERLRKKEFVRLDKSLKKVEGFNTVCVELLWDAPNVPILHKKEPELRIYLSRDHSYTPVKYEYMTHTGTTSEPKIIIVVISLQKMADGLWFPSQGFLTNLSDNLTNTYKASKVTVNQGLTDEDFDIEFPPGTKITDETIGLRYIENPNEE